MSRKVYVYENYSSNDPKKCGILYVDNIRGDEVYSFEYDDNWLISEEKKFPIAPLCGIKNEEGQLILESIKKIVKNSWEKIAKDYKVSRNEIEMMRNAFAFCGK